MLHLPPLIPVVDARLGPRLTEQVRRLGEAGFPMVRIAGEPPAWEPRWDELIQAVDAAWENGGWPAICVRAGEETTLRLLQRARLPWGLEVDGAREFPELAGRVSVVLGAGAEAFREGAPAGSAWDYAGVGPAQGQGTALALDDLPGTCEELNRRSIRPCVLGARIPEEAEACFRAGAAGLFLYSGDHRIADSGLLWWAQELRWRLRPPLRKGQGVALIGGSGCGKSTLARALGMQLDMDVKDIDTLVATECGKSIARIFQEEGEDRFRTLEREATCLAFRSPAVLALGGGAWESEAVRAAARDSGFTVLWIAENPGCAWRRVAQDSARPLARERDAFMARWRLRTTHWMEAPMILPLGRDPGRLAASLIQC